MSFNFKNKKSRENTQENWKSIFYFIKAGGLMSSFNHALEILPQSWRFGIPNFYRN
jgi:hypothetical protein